MKEMREFNETSEGLSLPQRAKVLTKLLNRQRKEEEAHKRHLRTFHISIWIAVTLKDFPERSLS